MFFALKIQCDPMGRPIQYKLTKGCAFNFFTVHFFTVHDQMMPLSSVYRIRGKARGSRTAIYLRSVFQSHLESLGSSVQKHAGKMLFVAILVLSTFCVGLKSAQIHSKVHQLWIQEGGRLESELAYTQKTIGEDEFSTHQLVIQTAQDANASVLHPQALLAHLEVLKKATAVKVHMFDTEWGLRDMCNSPTTPSFEGHYYIEQIFKHLIPCSIITPLDCFWRVVSCWDRSFPCKYRKCCEVKTLHFHLNA
ncbi:unnamed protein product [Ceratitis capitata]|uniref:(Mediterranean fruit fly) hypothetical protein n=1 Tax=Ceratitis capitata TaxID=7213 RepID=A0A811VA43_CERCA|nr:unnamed protein product [Ceratitis capitata]